MDDGIKSQSVPLVRCFLKLKQPPRYRHRLNSSRDEIHQHGTGIRCVIVEILTAHGEQRQLSHEFLILAAAALLVQKIEFLDVRCILNNTVQHI